MTLALDPTIAAKIKKVVLMGGNLHEPGNVTAAAEANIYCDPHAADQVFATHWPVTVVGLDVTHQIISTPEYFQRLEQRNPVTGKFLKEITQHYLDFYQSHNKIDGCHVHDSSAIACALHPEWFTVETGQLRVLCDETCRGKLIMHKENDIEYHQNPWAGRPNVDVAIQVRVDDIFQWLEEM